MVRSINKIQKAEAQLNDKILEAAFETYYPKLEADIKAVLRTKAPVRPPAPTRDEKDILAELLERMRALERKLEGPPAPNNLSAYLKEYFPDGIDESGKPKINLDALQKIMPNAILSPVPPRTWK
jgi:hypothetical protein